MTTKAHEDVHYAGAVYKYATVGEPGFPVAAVPRGRRVLIGKSEVFQIAENGFSNLSLIPTVILINHIGESVEGEPHVLLKITAISPSAAFRNA